MCECAERLPKIWIKALERVDRGERLISLGCEAFGYRPSPVTAKNMKPTT
jgi:hypothetical protein